MLSVIFVLCKPCPLLQPQPELTLPKIRYTLKKKKTKPLYALIYTILRPIEANEFCANVSLIPPKINPSLIAACLHTL